MKKILFAIIILALSFNYAYGQYAERIKEIRQLYKEYNDQKEEMDNFSFNFENCMECAFIYNFYLNFDDKMIVKEILSGEYSGSVTEYYFQNDEIFFVFYQSSKVENFDENGNTIVREVQMRFYFENGNVIKALKKVLINNNDTEIADFSTIPNVEVSYLKDEDAIEAYTKLNIDKILQFKKAISNFILDK